MKHNLFASNNHLTPFRHIIKVIDTSKKIHRTHKFETQKHKFYI